MILIKHKYQKMRIFKFGGASVKDAKAVKNVVKILQQEGFENTLVVISAMGKMTNAFEKVVDAYCNSSEKLTERLNFVKEFHQKICEELFDENHQVFSKIETFFDELSLFFKTNSSLNYNLIYDQVVSFGELLSTTIVSNYLNEQNVENTWLDVRKYIKTNANYRDAKVDWDVTEQNISKINKDTLYITQGFLGGNENNTTTLGREGSDYTAGIFAYCLDAKSVTIWKDVDGVLNADPREFDKTTLLKNLSYNEAIEMAFYGASVIHPKTIQPLERKNIPLFVRSFNDVEKQGTCVSDKGSLEKIPCFIVKKNQILISISAKDFSFMMEDNISEVFEKLHKYQLKVNLIQNSAMSFSVCVDDKFGNFDKFCVELNQNFELKTTKNVNLFTIHNFNDKSIEEIQSKGTTIIKQVNGETVQLVVKES